jgi:hypothetical protein
MTALLRFRSLTNVPWFLPGVVASVIVGYALRGRIARRLDVSEALGWALVVSIGAIVSATLTPLHVNPYSGGIGQVGCDFSRIRPATLHEILQFNDTILNIMLFIPLGGILAAVPGRRRKATLVAGAALMPILIELTQLVVRPLDRACQSADVVDNLMGLLIGFCIGAIAAGLTAWAWSSDPAPKRD